MTRPRKDIVSRDISPFYHVVCRCVRRSFLCGFDRVTNMDFSHRRNWIIERLQLLTEVFSIQIAAYAVMNNHYHLVVHIDHDAVNLMDDYEVALKWTSVFKGPPIVRRWLDQRCLSPSELKIVHQMVSVWRERLCSLSWFMKSLNQSIATMANVEDGCKGHFFESRFKSQAILDEVALLRTMVYVDLNPIRANIADAPEDSDFTSIQDRIKSLMKKEPSDSSLPVMELKNGGNIDSDIPYRLKDYVELVEWTGRLIHPQKRAHISKDLPPILVRLNIDPHQWQHEMKNRRKHHDFIGLKPRLEAICAYLQQSWMWGFHNADRILMRPLS